MSGKQDGRMKGAAKKPTKRFLIPSEEDLDKPIESIKKGSTFSLRKRPADEASSAACKEAQTQQSKQSSGKNSERSRKNEERHWTFKHDAAKDDVVESRSEQNVAFVEVVNKGSNESSEKGASNKEGNKIETTNEQTASIKTGSNSVIVNPRQRGNPVLKYIRNVAWEFGEVVPDYVLGQKNCALFLSLRYHNFNPEYIHDRLKQLGNCFELRILLVLVDVKDPHSSLKELSKICILSDCTLILAWSNEEAGRYLETYKSYENKPADILQEKVDGDYQSKMIDCLTSVKSVNKTDAVTLMANFGSLHGIVNASKEEISLCPGFGPQKAERLLKVFQEPFVKKNNLRKETEKANEKDKDSNSFEKEQPMES